MDDHHVRGELAAELFVSSNEAFTRAFQRAYGAPPSCWRSSGGTIHIRSPGGVHFYPPGGLRLPARAGVTSMNFAAELIDHHMSVRQLLDRAGELTDSQLDAVIELPIEGTDDNPTISHFRLDPAQQPERRTANRHELLAQEEEEEANSPKTRSAAVTSFSAPQPGRNRHHRGRPQAAHPRLAPAHRADRAAASRSAASAEPQSPVVGRYCGSEGGVGAGRRRRTVRRTSSACSSRVPSRASISGCGPGSGIRRQRL